ncbi:LysR family transcriptional regulator [Bordetella genomosp. 13]|uniref:LysR family transcriptional regulator n=1 Tax=Bordetella genomosp. 13 TaxID=463040 RepID=A0A1W6ZDL7_9BORD|nr:LysR family transcriptional regulator [Bordetella genomosp. 13]ARP95362.1 LysR family transcriptional regulator [Bordetella genomosp. 13]
MADFQSDETARRLASRLKMRHLALLLQIRQHGSLTRAAERMAISQPALTNTLAELEAMFGAPLFDRSVRGMAPTALGEVVLARAQAMLQDLQRLVDDMEAVASGHAAHLHVGVTPFIPGRILATAVHQAQPDGRRLTLTLHEGAVADLLPQLRGHALDLVVGPATSGLDLAQLSFEMLYRQPPRLIASRRLAARLGRQRMDWRMLAELDWILGAPQTGMRAQLTDIFLGAGIAAPLPLAESGSPRLIGEMIVASERAISILPADIAEELVRVAGVAVVPYTFAWNPPPIALFTRADETPRAAERLFAAALRDSCRQLYPAMIA